ncbi:MAG: 5'-nucleotidase C-terminal domain-containing protein [Burkholderiaceae bacterium]|jgi:5'-nucleotidase/UDP-sugar diphosphatase|nr:5'-nucleotidase C-terminal domain-containing protein [Burkholderiaceae bacterium]
MPGRQAGQERPLVPVGEADGVFDADRARVRSQPTALGTLIARAMRERTGADLVVINSGGVRDSLPAGRITCRDVVKVQPFANTVGVLSLSGAELLDWLAAATKMTPGSGGDPQTAGLQWTVANGALLEARVGGQPIDRSRSYKLAINNFTAIGGDGYPKMGNHPGYVNTGLNDAEVLRAYIAARSPLKLAEYAPDNR